MSNLPREAGFKTGLTNLKFRPGCKINPAVKDQASAKSETNWIFDLVVKLKKSREHIRVELPDLFHDKLEMLADRIRVLENELLWEGLESEFSSIMTLCDELNEKFKHLHDDGTSDSQLGAIDMVNGLFDALDNLDGLFSRLVSSETPVGNTLQPVKEQASAKSETNWIFDLIVKLKKIEEHTPEEFVRVHGDGLEKLKGFIRVLEKLEHELKLVPKENEKLWEGLESEFSSMMTVCDQLNDNYDHLYEADAGFICEDDNSNSSDSSDCSDCPSKSNTCSSIDLLLDTCDMVVSFFEALDKLDERCSRLVSPERTVGNCGKGLQTLDIGKEKVDYNKNNVPTPTEYKENKVIKIKSHDKLIEQLEMAQTSEFLVVMLFHAKRIKPSKEYLPNFYDLPNQYLNFGEDIKFLRVDVKLAATEFEVRAFPTVLLLVPDSCGLRVVEEVSIEETVIVPAFVKALKPRLDKILCKYCRYVGALQQV